LFGEWSPSEIGRSEIGRSEIGRSENGRSENGRCTLLFASFRTAFSLENELFAILQKHAKQPPFLYFASPKFATFSHLFASSENMGHTLLCNHRISLAKEH
jgi:hypothetical protein